MKKICALLAAMALCLSVLGGAGMTASAAFGDLLSQPCDFPAMTRVPLFQEARASL